MRAGCAPRAPCCLARQLRSRACERAPPLALPAGRACSPPDPLQLMLDARANHRFMLTVCEQQALIVASSALSRKHAHKRLARPCIKSGIEGTKSLAGSAGYLYVI